MLAALLVLSKFFVSIVVLFHCPELNLELMMG